MKLPTLFERRVVVLVKSSTIAVAIVTDGFLERDDQIGRIDPVTVQRENGDAIAVELELLQTARLPFAQSSLILWPYVLMSDLMRDDCLQFF